MAHTSAYRAHVYGWRPYSRMGYGMSYKVTLGGRFHPFWGVAHGYTANKPYPKLPHLPYRREPRYGPFSEKVAEKKKLAN